MSISPGVLLTVLFIIVSLCGPAVAATQTTAAGGTVIYRDNGVDPAGDQSDPSVDILSSSRTVSSKQGIRYLWLTVNAGHDYAQSLGSGLRVKSRLDSRSGPRVDYQLLLNLGDSGSGIQAGCLLWKRGEFGQATRTHLRVRDSGAISCRVLMSRLRATHHVHWWLLAYDYEGESVDYSGLTDRAPDFGWYL